MSYIGIISEYNPFHNGHAYMLEEALSMTGADGAISLMGGNFTQRGEPAIADKYTRAEAAVKGGLDAVFELPVVYATGSARDFAMGAVSIFNELNSVDYLAFGVEDDDIYTFNKVADILVEEPSEYKLMLNDALAKGLSYPAASEKAIKKIMGIKSPTLISSPNNILAISYITAMKKTKSKMMPILIKRSDAGYSSTKLSGNHSSATAIRHALSEGKKIDEAVSEDTIYVYRDYLSKKLPDVDWLTPFIASRLVYDRNLPKDLSRLDLTLDMTPELLNRLSKAPFPVKYVELQDYLKTKNLTMTRVSRVLLHLILGISNEDRENTKKYGCSEYVNLLAFNKNKTNFIKQISDNSRLTVINKKSAFTPQTKLGERMWQLDKLATDLYNQIIYENLNIRLHSELSSPVKSVK